MTRFLTHSPEETMRVGAWLAKQFKKGEVVLLVGDLGAGKTTLVRGLLAELGFLDSVRSPTFNLIQVYPVQPPVVHADLYRIGSAEGLGLEDYFDTHVVLVEWPDRLGDLVNPEDCWRVVLSFSVNDRVIEVSPPPKSR